MKELGKTVFYHDLYSSFEIAKIPLCLLVAFSSLFGYAFAVQGLAQPALPLFLSVFFLACGGATFNSFQERKQDGLMKRTHLRPLVKGSLSNFHAVVQSSLLIFLGLAGLLLFTTPGAFFAGIVGIATYNLIYTQLKPYSIHAIVPGAICGAVPPYIGWLAGEGDLFSFNASLPVLLLLFWQIPHFFLVLLNHKNDYLESFSPNLLKRFSEPGLRRIFLPWITALAATMLTFSVIPSKLGGGERAIIVVNAAVLIILFYIQLLFSKSPNYKGLFRYLNFSIFLVMLIVCFGSATMSG